MSVKRAASEFSGTQRFALEGRLGEGGMGVVYRARDRSSGAVVALKTMTHLEPAGLLRFKNEFRSLADIVHPNVVQLHELISEGEHWFFTMQLVEGVDFLSYTQEEEAVPSDKATLVRPISATVSTAPTMEAAPLGTPVTPVEPVPVSVGGATRACNLDRLRSALRQLFEGIGAIHAAGKLHRDIKPSNVMVTRDGRVVLLDFGVVTDFEKAPRARIEENIFGTPAYMAPEQARGVSVGPSADLYAIGVMAYEALTCQLPFEGSPQDVLLAKQRSLPPPPSRLVSGIPRDLDELVTRLLQSNPDDRPGLEQVFALLESAGRNERVSLVTTSSHASFVGRARELAALERAQRAASEGSAALTLISGPSGMGKTALAQRFLGQLEQQGAVLTLAGRCFEREALPFKGMDSVIDELSRHLMQARARDVERWIPKGVDALSRVFPVLRSVPAIEHAPPVAREIVDPVELRRRAFAALRELLGRLCADAPVVIHIDDVQWSDVDTTALLEELLRPPLAPPVLWLCTFREEARGTSPAVEALLSLGKRFGDKLVSAEVRVGELSSSEATELAESALGSTHGVAAEAVSAIVDQAHGMPFFLAELAQRERERRSLAPEASKSADRTLALEEMISERVASLPDDARAVLEVLSVAGRPLSYGIAESIAVSSGLATPEGVSAARALLRTSRLVRSYRGTGEEHAEPYHAKIREGVVARLPLEGRRDWHGRVAVALEANQGDPEALVEHYLAASRPADARRFVLRAADAAAESLAFLRAQRLYQLALDLEVDAPAHELLRRRADALVSAGRSSEGAEVYLRAAERAPEDLRVDLRRLAAEHYLKSGRDVHGVEVLRGVLSDVGLSYPDSKLAAVGALVWNRARLRGRPLLVRERSPALYAPSELARVDVAFSATAGLAMIDVVRGASFGAEHLRLALDAGEPRRICRALAYEASSHAAAGAKARDRVERMVRTAEDLAARSGDPANLANARMAAGLVRVFAGEWRSAQRVLEEAEKILRERCRGVHWELTNTLAWICNALILSGELREAARRVPAILQEARERDDRYALMHMTYPACITRLAAGDVDGALAIARDDAPFKGLEGGRFTGGHWGGLISNISVLRYQGDGDGALRHLREQWPKLEASQFLRVELMRVCSLFERGLTAVSAAETAPNPRNLLAEAERCAERLRRERLGYAAAMGAHVAGCAAALRGDRRLATERFREAYAGLAAADMAYLAACAALRLGRLLEGNEGATLREQGRLTFERQGVIDGRACLAMSAPGFRGEG